VVAPKALNIVVSIQAHCLRLFRFAALYFSDIHTYSGIRY